MLELYNAEYQGEVNVLLVNHWKMYYEIKLGECIALLMVQSIYE